MTLTPLYALALSAAFSTAAYAKDHTKTVSTAKTDVDGHSYKVIRYDNNSVKVVIGAAFRVDSSQAFTRRDRMRRAVKQATECSIVDDFENGGKLIGSLSCNPTSKGE